jgi:hypothetical protein
VRKVDDKRVNKSIVALAISGSSRSHPWMVRPLELVDIGGRFGNELAQRIASRSHPKPDPSVTHRLVSRRFLGSPGERCSTSVQRALLDAEHAV